MKKLKKTKDIVKHFLKKHSCLRDNDNALLTSIWTQELITLNKSGAFFLSLYLKGKLTNAESIRRCRQKLQQENPKLRGENYKGRKIAADLVKGEIINWDKK